MSLKVISNDKQASKHLLFALNIEQKAQLSQRGSAMLRVRVIEYVA